MASTGHFFLTICFALLTTACALECYSKIEVACSPSGFVCTALTILGNLSMTPTECEPNVTMCSSMTLAAAAKGFEFQSEVAACVPFEGGSDFLSGCYSREDLERISSTGAEQLRILERVSNVTIKTAEICLCQEDLCNGSIKSVLSIFVVIWSLVTGLVVSV